MYKKDMEIRPFCLFLRHFLCNLKISLINSVITPFKVLIISIAGCQIFWWWMETETCNKSFIKHIHINEHSETTAIIMQVLRVHLAYLMPFGKLRLHLFRVIVFRQDLCVITLHNKSF